MSHHNPDPNKNINLTIDGIPVTVPEGTRILEAAKIANVKIPTLCEHPDLCKRALCRICVVECDGKGKLLAACANDVWEGVKVVTNNLRLLYIRNTILKLILANHPQECLFCTRNKNCELQTLAMEFGLCSVPVDAPPHYQNLFASESQRISNNISVESNTLVRDMDKCIKCCRCSLVCQEVQTTGAINTSRRGAKFEICAPYKQPLEDSPCVFCGECAAVCPVGAIYEYDQTFEIWDSINDKARRTIAQVPSKLASLLTEEFSSGVKNSNPNTENLITTGKMITAVKMLGFDKVYNADISFNAANSALCAEIKQRQKNPTDAKNVLPIISGCTAGVTRFVKHFYPDLENHLVTDKNIRQFFKETFKNEYASSEQIDISNITTVSFSPCLSQKYGSEKPNYVLTVKELAKMIKMAGIEIIALTESPFDEINLQKAKFNSPNQNEDEEIITQRELVFGFGKARKVMETIRNGKCSAKWIEIASCQNGKCYM